MEREEALKRTDHYRCRLCGQISPITEILCTKPGCRAQLGIYGELILAEKKENASAPQKQKVKEPEEKIKRKAYAKKEKSPRRDKKQDQTAPAPAASIRGKNTIKVVSLLLSAAMIILLYTAWDELLHAAQFSNNWRAKYWIYDAQSCIEPMIPILVSMLMVLFFYNKKTKRPVVNIISVLFHAVMVGWFMYIWEGARYDGLSATFCSMCALAALNCALWLNTISLKRPILFLVAGILLGAWGVLELVAGQSIYFDDRFTLLFLEAGILLVLTGVRNLHARKQTAEVST